MNQKRSLPTSPGEKLSANASKKQLTQKVGGNDDKFSWDGLKKVLDDKLIDVAKKNGYRGT